jgi:YVTN family beta-propeller protein
MSTHRLVSSVLVFSAAMALGIPHSAAGAEFATLVDIDDDTATGCAVSSFQGADFELVTTLDASVTPPVVTALALNQCSGGAFVPYAGPNPFTQFPPPWPAGADAFLDAIETYLPLSVGTTGPAIRLGFYSGPRTAPADVLFTTDGSAAGAPIVLPFAVVEIPTASEWGALGFALLLAAIGLHQLRSGAAKTAAACLSLAAGLGIASAAAPHIPDGLLLDWTGHAAVANDVFPPADAPINFEIRRAFATVENDILMLRLDVDANQPPATRFAGATSSQPLALSGNGDLLAVANPDNDSVSFFDVRDDRDLLIGTVPVESEPNGVVLSPDGSRAYAANTVSGTVSVIDADLANGSVQNPTVHIPVGVEPYALVMTPNGTKLYVANARSNSVSVINPATQTVLATIPNVGVEPRGLAVTDDGDADDADEKLYVTSFLAVPVAAKVPGADDGKQGVVKVISTATDTVIGTAAVQPLADSGFPATGDALAREAPGSGTFPTGAFPNQLQNVAIHGAFAYLPSTGASPNGPLRFDLNTQSLLSAIDTTTDADAGVTVNLQGAVAAQSAPQRLFVTQPWAMAFEHASDTGYVVSAASDLVIKVAVNATSGAPSVLLDPSDPTRVLEIAVGRNPRGIVVNAADTRAYVMNYVSRDVSVLDLTPAREQVIATLASAPLPTPGTPADQIQIGKELYYSSVGTFDPATPGGSPIRGRLSADGWSACANCHPFGLSDQVVWIFPNGPRRTIAQHADFDPSDPQRQQARLLDWSADRDEPEDFERHIRQASGGAGLIVLPDGTTPDPNVEDLLPLANQGRNQLRVRGVPAWDALRAFIQFGIRAPISPISKTDPDVIAGRALYISANCQQCHGGPQWTSGLLIFTPPPPPAQVTLGQWVPGLRQVGTFNLADANEVRQDGSATPLGASGFAPASLLSAFAFEGSLLHGGRAATFDDVLSNVTHRSAGTSGVDTLANAADRAKIAAFLRSIDAASVPVPAP